MTTAVEPVSPVAHSGKGWNVTLWVLQALLGAFFLAAGVNHGLVPVEQAAKSAPWVTDIPFPLLRFIGYSEVAGGLGLLLPSITRILPWLTPLAGVGVAIIMALAIPFHVQRNEANVIGMHFIVGGLALLVAWGRWKRAPDRRSILKRLALECGGACSADADCCAGSGLHCMGSPSTCP
jgi:uncharacterized membrane protein